MSGFTSLGYAADNELSPEAWKQYMLNDIGRRESNAQMQLQEYLQMQQAQKRQQKYQSIQQGIQGLGSLATAYLGQPGGDVNDSGGFPQGSQNPAIESGGALNADTIFGPRFNRGGFYNWLD